MALNGPTKKAMVSRTAADFFVGFMVCLRSGQVGPTLGLRQDFRLARRSRRSWWRQPPLGVGQGGGGRVKSDSWSAAWQERDALLAVARRRTSSLEEAEDIVSEALLRSQETVGVDEARLGGWLTTVTMRLCVDAARTRGHEDRLKLRLPRGAASEPDPADTVCDRAHAAWIAGRLPELPERQRRALQLRAEGRDVAEVAAALGVSYRVADGLLQRARRHMRNVLAAASAWIMAVAAALVRSSRRDAAPVALVCSAALLGGVLLASPYTTPIEDASAAPANDVFSQQLRTRPLAARAPGPAPSSPATPRETRPAPAAATAGSPPAATSRSVPLPVALVAPTRAPKALTVGSIKVEDKGSRREAPNETFEQSLLHCLQEGIRADLEQVGCSPSDGREKDAKRQRGTTAVGP